MKRLIVPAVAVACVALAVPAFAASARTVSLKDNVFSAKAVTVKKGTTITWVWKGSAPHNVTVVSGPKRFRSGTRSRGATYRQRLTKAGTYRIACTIHSGMTQVIRVR